MSPLALPTSTLLIFIFFVSHIAAASLNLCPLDGNATITNSSLTWGQVLEKPIQSFLHTSYLRPDIGGALIPYVYTGIILIVHIPVVIIRVVRWETVQTWCLVTTFFTITLTVQSYISTKFAADKVLTWTPLMLVIDAGSMSQILFLVVDDFKLLPRLRSALAHFVTHAMPRRIPSKLQDRKSSDVDEGQPLEDKDLEATSMPKSPWKDRSFWVALLAFLHLLAILILQMLGLAKALRGSKAPQPLVSWCSPIFSPFGQAALDGNCNVYPILQTFKKGVGCIMIQGSQQMTWLKATVAGTALSLALETFDICILALVHSTTRWRGVKMRRPWFTMFTGIAVLALVLVFGIVYSSNLPPGISERIWIVTDAGSPQVWAGKLGTAGLRGAIIGWNDGVFAEWASTYFGSWASD